MTGTWRFFDDDEVDFVTANPEMSDHEVGLALGRSAGSIKSKRKTLAAGKIPYREAWTADEDALVLATPHMTAAQVGLLIHRSTSAVESRRKMFAAVKGVKFGGSNKDANQIGARPLVCKTCKGCGRLLQALWFSRDLSRRTWASKCTRCHKPLTRKVNKAAADASVAKSRAKLQGITKPHAERNGYAWVEADHVVLADPDLTITEKALALGRTHASAAMACHLNGYKSLVGKGDPDRDQWLIENPNQIQEAS